MIDIEDNWNQMALAYENFTESEDSYSYTIEWPCIKKTFARVEWKKDFGLGMWYKALYFFIGRIASPKNSWDRYIKTNA